MLTNGNLAIAKAAIAAGCRLYFGYPITPQNNIPEYMSSAMPEKKGIFLQAESEIAAINMVYGAASAGKRVMTTSSSPGISLMQEGISFLCTAELPCVIANIMRGGPGLGNIQVAQSDYFQSTKGGGHGDYRTIVLAPASVQECFDLTIKAFDLADIYRIPVIILSDALIGRMSESFVTKNITPAETEKGWIVGKKKRNIVKTLYLEENALPEV
ncbi:MAG: 3-methyl-2-oxobutanoate dehydrogenase subunit beta, partial [archaeon]|nr:3-methyl-2-oxobutanoate dehydrogenase subunit beta [archaeon]